MDVVAVDDEVLARLLDFIGGRDEFRRTIIVFGVLAANSLNEDEH